MATTPVIPIFTSVFILFLISDKRIVNTLCEGIHAGSRGEVGRFARIVYVSELNQNTWHTGGTKNEESSLVNSLVNAASGCAELLLDESGKLHAALHILVLHELEDDIAFAGIGVEAFVLLLVVVLEGDDGVLALSDGKVVSCGC